MNLKENPCQKVGSMGKKKNRKMLFWTKEEYLKFADAMMDKPMSYYAFEMLYWTGMELCIIRSLLHRCSFARCHVGVKHSGNSGPHNLQKIRNWPCGCLGSSYRHRQRPCGGRDILRTCVVIADTAFSVLTDKSITPENPMNEVFGRFFACFDSHAGFCEKFFQKIQIPLDKPALMC